MRGVLVGFIHHMVCGAEYSDNRGFYKSSQVHGAGITAEIEIAAFEYFSKLAEIFCFRSRNGPVFHQRGYFFDHLDLFICPCENDLCRAVFNDLIRNNCIAVSIPAFIGGRRASAGVNCDQWPLGFHPVLF